jgi:hypothetical protein
MSLGLWVFFDPPFWVGVLEKVDGKSFASARIVFGAQPKDAGVYAFIRKRIADLEFSPSHEVAGKSVSMINPKRLQRLARREVRRPGISDKSREAQKLLMTEGKNARLKESRERRAETAERRFVLRRQKSKEKRRGR